MNDKPKCCATVWPATGRHKSGHGPLRQAQCQNAGKYRIAGKWYCGRHVLAAEWKATKQEYLQ